MAAILTNGVLKIRTAPIFQPLLAPARYKGSGSTKARDVPPPMPRIVRPGGRQRRLRHAAPDGQAHSQPTDQPPSPPTHAGAASSQQSPAGLSGLTPTSPERLRRPAFRGRPRRRLTTSPPNSAQRDRASSPDTAQAKPPSPECTAAGSAHVTPASLSARPQASAQATQAQSAPAHEPPGPSAAAPVPTAQTANIPAHAPLSGSPPNTPLPRPMPRYTLRNRHHLIPNQRTSTPPLGFRYIGRFRYRFRYKAAPRQRYTPMPQPHKVHVQTTLRAQ